MDVLDVQYSCNADVVQAVTNAWFRCYATEVTLEGLSEIVVSFVDVVCESADFMACVRDL